MTVKPTTTLGYMKGLRRDVVPYEDPLASNQEKLAVGFDPGVERYADIRYGGPRSPSRRMAGDKLELKLLEPGFVPEPYAPGTDIRDINKRIASLDFLEALRNF